MGSTSGLLKSHLQVDSNSIEVAILKGEREKRLENLVMYRTMNCFVYGILIFDAKLQKTKKDKDKAVRFIIDMIGKVRRIT